MGTSDIDATVSLVSDSNERNIAVGSFRVSVESSNTLFEVLNNSGTGEVLVHGENDRMQYEGLTEDDQNKYCLGYYDPQTNKLRIMPVPVVSMSSVVKSKKRARGPAIRQLNVKNITQRTALGEAFGTKKAKKAISDVERNRVDADQLADFEAAIVDSVQTTTSTLPSAIERQDALSSERPIPPYDLSATKSEDIYPFADGIASSTDIEAINTVIARLSSLDETAFDEILALFPAGTPSYLQTRLSDTLKLLSKKQKTEKLVELYYVSLLFAFYANRRVPNKTTLVEKLGNNPPDVLVRGLLDKFAVSKAGLFGKQKDRSYAVDPASENRLLCYLLALVLRINGYSVGIPPLAQELSLKPSKLTDLFKALGCNVKPPTVGQAEALGISKQETLTFKVASLSAPLKLPDVAKRRRGGGR